MDEKDVLAQDAPQASNAPPYKDEEKRGGLEEEHVATTGAITREGLPLHPQPTGDPLDPLNWSTWRKHGILGIVMMKYGPIVESTGARRSSC